MKLLDRWIRKASGIAADPVANIGSTQEKLGFCLSSITFSDGAEIKLTSNSIIVLTGPNNVGKSSALTEIASHLHDGKKLGPVLRSLNAKATGPEKAFKELIESGATYYEGDLVIGSQLYSLDQIHEDYKKSFIGSRASRLLLSHLRADDRLSLVEPKRRDRDMRAANSFAFRIMEIDEEAELRLSEAYEKAFGKKLALNRFGGSCRCTFTMGSNRNSNRLCRPSMQLGWRSWSRSTSKGMVFGASLGR